MISSLFSRQKSPKPNASSSVKVITSSQIKQTPELSVQLNNKHSNINTGSVSSKELIIKKAINWMNATNPTNTYSSSPPSPTSLVSVSVQSSNENIRERKEVKRLPVITPPPEDWFACRECSCIVNSAILCPTGCKAGSMQSIETVLKMSVFCSSLDKCLGETCIELSSDTFKTRKTKCKKNDIDFPITKPNENIAVRLTGVDSDSSAYLSVNSSRIIPGIVTRLVFTFAPNQNGVYIGSEGMKVSSCFNEKVTDFIILDCYLDLKSEKRYGEYVESNYDFWHNSSKVNSSSSFSFKYFTLSKENPSIVSNSLNVPLNSSVSFIASILNEIHQTSNTRISFVGKNFQICPLVTNQLPFELTVDCPDSFFVVHPEYMNPTRISEFLRKVPGLIICKDCAIKETKMIEMKLQHENQQELNIKELDSFREQISALQQEANTANENYAHALAENKIMNEKLDSANIEIELLKRQLEDMHRAVSFGNVQEENTKEGQVESGSTFGQYMHSSEYLPEQRFDGLVKKESKEIIADNLCVSIPEHNGLHYFAPIPVTSPLKSCMKQASPTTKKPTSIGFDSECLFFEMAASGTVKEFDTFLKSNRDFNISATNPTGCNAFHIAASQGNVDVLNFLMQQTDFKSTINNPDYEGWTALHQAVYNDSIECVKILVENGSNIEYRNSDGNRPIDLAESEDVLEYLKAALDRKFTDANVMCLHNWQGQDDDEISAKPGDIFEVLDRGENEVIAEWWYVRKSCGTEGFIPRSYVGCVY